MTPQTQALTRAAESPPPTLYVQAGAFAVPANAQALLLRLQHGGLTNAFILPPPPGSHLFRVRVGPVASVPDFEPWRRGSRRWESPTRDWRTTDKLARLIPIKLFEDPKRMIRSLLAAALLSIAHSRRRTSHAPPRPSPPAAVPARAYLLEDFQTGRVLASDQRMAAWNRPASRSS